MSTATMSSSGASAVRFGPSRKSAIAIVRPPRCEATSTTASTATSGGSASPAGEAVARLPPTVPRLRICGEPTVRAAVREARQLAGELRDQPRVRHAGAEPDGAVAALPVEQLGHAGQVDHPRRAGGGRR